MQTLLHLDSPTQQPLGARFMAQGWVASEAPLGRLQALGQAGCTRELQREARPDVVAALPHLAYHTGFRVVLDRSFLVQGNLVFECEAGDQNCQYTRALPKTPLPADKTARLERLRPLLRKDLPCLETPFHFDFLTEELRQRFSIVETAAVSGFEYAPEIRAAIDACRDGLVLDCGAGRRPSTHANIINLEIVPYPSTDVIAVNECLPFVDNSFDLVISCAVLEHVKDPFAAAKEIVRVTKPGGRIWADIPFLQPFHGYPSHYYNMTMEGAKHLFAEGCAIEREFVPHYGLPVWALTWFLNSYAAGLEPETRAAFLKLRVGDLLGEAVSYLDQPWVRGLSAAKNIELACTNTVVAHKV